jgi:transcriptional regulator with XRE-family HTH domain
MKEEQTLKLFGLRVKKIRQNLKLSQEDLAAIADLDRTYISGIERGKRNISLINIVKLSSSLNITPSELMLFTKE